MIEDPYKPILINNCGELNSGSFDALHIYLVAYAFLAMRLNHVFVILDPCDIYRHFFIDNSVRLLNSDSFDVLHAYLAAWAFLAMRLDQFFAIVNPEPL